MLTRPIPQSQEPLPVVGFGTWQTFDIGSDRQELDRRKEVLSILFEAGGKVIEFLADVRPRRSGGGATAQRDAGPCQGLSGHQGLDHG